MAQAYSVLGGHQRRMLQMGGPAFILQRLQHQNMTRASCTGRYALRWASVGSGCTPALHTAALKPQREPSEFAADLAEGGPAFLEADLIRAA